MQFNAIGPDGIVVDERDELRGDTSLTLEEMEVAGAALHEACSSSSEPAAGND